MESDAVPAGLEPHSLRILVVEDNADILLMMDMLLSCWGHKPRLAETGPVALNAARQEAPDVVLLDLGLPGMDGFEVARRLRSQPGGDQIVIIAVTALKSDSYQQRAREIGFDGYLVKPVDFEALHHLLITLRLPRSGATQAQELP